MRGVLESDGYGGDWKGGERGEGMGICFWMAFRGGAFMFTTGVRDGRTVIPKQLSDRIPMSLSVICSTVLVFQSLNQSTNKTLEILHPKLSGRCIPIIYVIY